MKRSNTFLVTLLTFLTSVFIFTNTLNAQLVGTKTIPGDYATITAAVTDLNTLGVGSGGVTFNVAAGYTESVTAPILITATGTLSNPIVFQKSGVGANPIISRTDAGTLSTSTLGGQGDAIIIIQGSDYVTFDAIDVTASDQGIEYGYYLRKGSDVNGCKFVTIKNATVTLNKGTSAYVAGIYSSNNDSASLISSATGITVTSVDGRNENLTLTGNTISNVFAGIVLRGFNHSTAPYDFYDQNFVVGANGAGNIIQNYGGNAAASTYAVYLIYHNNASVSYNNINNTNGGGTGATSTFYGIFNSTGTLSSFIANNNNINITTSAAASATYGINNAATGNLEINNNVVTINTTAANTGAVGFIYNTSAAASLTVSINNNTFIGTTLNVTGSTYLIYNNSSQLTPGITNVTGNSIYGVINRTGATGTTYCYYNNGSPTGVENIFNNVFDSVTTTGTGALYGILSTTGASHTHNIYDNTIRDFTCGTGTVYGIHRTLASGEIYDNEVYNLVGGGTVYGLSNGSGNNRIFRNIVYNLTSNTTGTTAGSVTGVLVSGSTNTHVYNNFISDLKAPTCAATDAIRGIGITSTAASSTIGLYYNTIYLNASSTGANFGTSGIFHTNSTTATTAALDMRNNVVVNTSTAVGTGLTVAFRRSAANTALNNYSTLSNNNDLYAGTPGVVNLIFNDGTNSDQTLTQFKTRVTPRESASISENPTFVNSTTPPYNLRINTTVPTQIESGAAPVTTPVAITADFDGDLRNITTPDLGADEFTGIALDLTAPLISYNTLSNQSNTTSVSLTANITDISGIATGTNLPRMYLKKGVNGTFVFDDLPTANGSDYTFTINYAAAGGVAIGDTVYYYIAAQDQQGNAGTNPTGGSGSNPPGTVAPASLYSYLIVDVPLSGTYTVGLAAFNSAYDKNVYTEKRIRTVQRDLNGVDATEDILGQLVTKENGGSVNNQLSPNIVEVTEEYYVLMENGLEFNQSFFRMEGTEGIYPTLTSALTDLFNRGVAGPVTFLLVDALYSNETYPIVLPQVTGMSSTNTVTIKPAVGVSAEIPGSPAQTTSTIQVAGGDYYIFDGSNTAGGTTQNLKIAPIAIGTIPTIHLFSAANNNIFKNLIVEGKNTSAASGSFLFGSGDPSNNNLIDNCIIKDVDSSADNHAVGLYFFSSIAYSNNTLQNSTIKNFTARGIYLRGAPATNLQVLNNTIYNTEISTSIAIYGVQVDRCDGTIITGNKIYDIATSSTSSSAVAGGLYFFGGSASGDLLFANNTISLGASLVTTTGIQRCIDYYAFSVNNFQAFYNTVFVGGSGVTDALQSSGIAKRDVANTFRLVDNIFYNERSNGTGNAKHYAISFDNTIATTLELNYNNYFANGTGGFLGKYSTTDISNITDWRTATTQDVNSISGDPLFVSDTDYRLNFLSPSYATGIPVAGITTDILGVTRSATNPSMGAYESPVATIGWANLQWPPSGTIIQGQSLTAYAQIWIDGITNQPGPGTGIQAWIGINSTDTDPSTWTTWVPAVYNVDAGNNDEYMAMIGSSLTPGMYYYASRFNVFGGAYYYGGFNGSGGGQWNGTTNVSGVLTVEPPLNTLWERAAYNTTLPSWFGTDLERGLAYGKSLDGTEALNNRVFVVSRTGGLFVRVLNAANGSDVGTLNTTGITGGTFALNDIGVTEDGKIIGCNMTTNAFSSAFKLYIWDNELSTPVEILSYVGGDSVRLGDKFTVVGNYNAGTMAIWAASATTAKHRVYKWTMSLGVINPVPQIIYCSDAITTGISSAAVGPLPNGDFFWNANGQNARKYSANGTLLGTIPGTLVGTGSNAIRYLGQVGANEYLATFIYGTGNQNARILELPNGNPTSAVLYAITTPLGTSANANGAGDVDFQVDSNLSVNVYVLATNNGLGAYNTTRIIPVELSTFAASVNEREVVITWSTATELNNRGFELERKLEGEWQKITYIEGKGTTTEQSDYSFTDNFAFESYQGTVQYRLKQLDFDGTISYSNVISVDVDFSPREYALYQNYPNPFNPSTTIKFALPFISSVNIKVFNVLGEQVSVLFNEVREAGYHNVSFNAGSLASGIYMYSIEAKSVDGMKNYNTVKKMMLIK